MIKKKISKVNRKITKKTNIMEALEINPEAIEILAEKGMGCIGCGMAQFETLEQGLKAHGFSKKQIDETIKELNE